MEANPISGIISHAVRGLKAASFYIPNSRVKGRERELSWQAAGRAVLILPVIIIGCGYRSGASGH